MTHKSEVTQTISFLHPYMNGVLFPVFACENLLNYMFLNFELDCDLSLSSLLTYHTDPSFHAVAYSIFKMKDSHVHKKIINVSSCLPGIELKQTTLT